MPMIPELPISMLACARIGAIHSVVFGGFSADRAQGRIKDADAKVVITADGGYRRGAPIALKPTVDEAVAECPGIEHVLVVKRTGQDVELDRRRTSGGTTWWTGSPTSTSARAARRRGPAVHPLHQRHHR